MPRDHKSAASTDQTNLGFTPAMHTSVVIAVRNDPDGLQATLRALERQTVGRAALEVIVVDDASTDETLEVAERSDGVTVIRSATPRGAYDARNAGIRRSGGRFIAITDAGCVPAEDWVAEGTAPLEGNPLMVVAGRISMPLGPRPSLAAMVDVVHHLDQESYVRDQGSAVTANIFAGRSVFDLSGLFDGRLKAGGDREWVVRAREAGATLVYRKEAVVEHEPRRRAREVIAKSARVARGASFARANSEQPGSAPRPLYRTCGWIKPWNRARGRERLDENGAQPGGLRWLAVGMAQVALVQFPQAAISAYWDLKLHVQRRHRRQSDANDEPG